MSSKKREHEKATATASVFPETLKAKKNVMSLRSTQRHDRHIFLTSIESRMEDERRSRRHSPQQQSQQQSQQRTIDELSADLSGLRVSKRRITDSGRRDETERENALDTNDIRDIKDPTGKKRTKTKK